MDAHTTAPVPPSAAVAEIAPGEPVAIVDIGSNSVRLVAYSGLSRAPTPLYNEKAMCGLGRAVATTGRLHEDGIRRALQALARFRELCRTIRVGRIHVLATAAARDAENGPDFLRAAEEAIGQPIELLSGRREAELSALGVVSGFYAPDGVVGDLGGGSLELVDVRGVAVGQGVTTPLGGLALQDLSGGSLKKARRLAADTLKRAAPQLETLRGRTFYAVGGTWRALARLHQATRGYPLHVMHGYTIAPADELSFLEVVERVDAATLAAVESVSEARRPLLAYGAVVLEEIIRSGRPREIAVSATGVREGLLYELLDPAQRALDPLLAAAEELNRLRARCPGHGAELQAWTDAFMASLDRPETSDERRLRHAACLLADIGWRTHPDYRGEQSLNLIAHGSFVAIDHPGRAYLAVAVFFRHEGVAPEKASPTLRQLAGGRLFELARLLGAALRVAFPISVAMEGVLPRTPLLLRDGALVLHLPEDLRALASDRLVSRLRGLARLVGVEARIAVGA
ncbi:Ppx/GppA phosphatase [Methylobacterium sp. 4-46]|uniref:exopolyphosphatase n=1 Tax=unclassified Methylobacterium TaxID=2615210 RepID=UPI000152D00B|nr:MULTISPECIES: exopolyphosphatase [Methylobacterium]ACA19484.1 Ppx/GppA phosphatase [Methylobacterium sp. 4-46]WFT78682.1 exopolyphosphatase [Methylobacterium nodulans]